MTNKKMKKIIIEIYNNYKEVKPGIWVYEGEHKTAESAARYRTSSILSELNLIALEAQNAIMGLYSHLVDMPQDELKEDFEITDSLQEGLQDLCDNLSIYTYDNNNIISSYGVDEALELYKEVNGSIEGVTALNLAYHIHDNLINTYVYNLVQELEK